MNLCRLAPVFAFATLAALADAKTLIVSQTGAITKIQDAIDAAAPGDTILVKAGVYFENLQIQNKNGLKLRGAGQVILEGRKIGSPGQGPAVNIGSGAPNVEIRNLLIRNAHDATGNPGRGILASGNGLRLKNVRIENCKVSVLAEGDDVLIEDCQFKSRRVEIVGNDARVDGCVFTAIDDQGLVFDGENLRVSNSKFDVISGSAITGTGNEAFIDGCAFRTITDDAIFMTSDDARIEGCSFQNVGDRAAEVIGSAAIVRANKIRDVGVGVIVIGAGPRIEKNKLERVFAAHGIELIAGPGAIVDLNVMRDVQGAGVFINSGGIGTQVTRNSVIQGAALKDSAGYVLEANNITMFDNLAKGTAHHGVRVTGAACQIESLTTTRNLEDGLRVEGGAAGAQLTDILATKNGRHGVANLAANVGFSGGILIGNRLDLASNQSFALLNKVKFVTGGANLPVEPK